VWAACCRGTWTRRVLAWAQGAKAMEREMTAKMAEQGASRVFIRQTAFDKVPDVRGARWVTISLILARSSGSEKRSSGPASLTKSANNAKFGQNDERPWEVMIKTKSVFSPIEPPKDGLRILASRFRGRRMSSSLYAVWMATLGPSGAGFRAVRECTQCGVAVIS